MNGFGRSRGAESAQRGAATAGSCHGGELPQWIKASIDATAALSTLVRQGFPQPKVARQTAEPQLRIDGEHGGIPSAVVGEDVGVTLQAGLPNSQEFQRQGNAASAIFTTILR